MRRLQALICVCLFVAACASVPTTPDTTQHHPWEREHWARWEAADR